MFFNKESVRVIEQFFTVEDLKDLLRGALKREPTDKDVDALISEIDEGLVLYRMAEAGWGVINEAKLRALKKLGNKEEKV